MDHGCLKINLFTIYDCEMEILGYQCRLSYIIKKLAIGDNILKK